MCSKVHISSHENKKALTPFYIFLREKECKPLYWSFKFIFYQKYFYNKKELKIFYFQVAIYALTRHYYSMYHVLCLEYCLKIQYFLSLPVLVS